jgi:hypothetical protein
MSNFRVYGLWRWLRELAWSLAALTKSVVTVAVAVVDFAVVVAVAAVDVVVVIHASEGTRGLKTSF